MRALEGRNFAVSRRRITGYVGEYLRNLKFVETRFLLNFSFLVLSLTIGNI